MAVMHLGPREHAFTACFMFSKSRIHASPGRQEAAELQAPKGEQPPSPPTELHLQRQKGHRRIWGHCRHARLITLGKLKNVV